MSIGNPNNNSSKTDNDHQHTVKSDKSVNSETRKTNTDKNSDKIQKEHQSQSQSRPNQAQTQSTQTKTESQNRNEKTIDVEISSDTVPQITVAESQEITRSKIAWLFTVLFLITIFSTALLPFIMKIINPQSIDDPLTTAKEIVTSVASVLGGPFGFIIGFYFTQEDNNN